MGEPLEMRYLQNPIFSNVVVQRRHHNGDLLCLRALYFKPLDSNSSTCALATPANRAKSSTKRRNVIDNLSLLDHARKIVRGD